MDENEEFEFRARAEREQGLAPKPELNVLQRRMGLGKQGDSTETIRHAINTAGERAGGAVTDATAQVLPHDAAAALGYGTNFLVNAATEAPGVLLGGGGTKKVVQPVLEEVAKRTMQSALKPSSKALANGDAAKAIQTMLEEGISATPGGAAKLRKEIHALRGEVDDLIKNSPATVDKAYAASEIYKTLDKFRSQVNPGADVDAIMKSWQEFNALVGAKIPVQQAQALKSGTQGVLRDSYGRITTTPAQEAAQKAMASGLREGIADAVPGVAERNAQMSAKHNALNILEPAAAKAGNHNPIGSFAPLAHSPEMATLMMAERNPWVRSLIAHAVHQNSGTAPIAIGAVGGATLEDIIQQLRTGQ